MAGKASSIADILLYIKVLFPVKVAYFLSPVSFYIFVKFLSLLSADDLQICPLGPHGSPWVSFVFFTDRHMNNAWGVLALGQAKWF